MYGVGDIKNHNDFATAFENNKKAIDTFNYNLSQDSYDAYSRVISEYGFALSIADDDRKALPYLDKAIGLLQNNKKHQPDKLFQAELYEYLLWHRGKCNFSLGRHKLAKPDFDLLIKQYPDNLIYQKWTTEFNNVKLIQAKNVFYILIGILILIYTFFQTNGLISNINFCLFIFSVIGTITVEIILYRRRNINSEPQIKNVG